MAFTIQQRLRISETHNQDIHTRVLRRCHGAVKMTLSAIRN
jgi:hypothetical protein